MASSRELIPTFEFSVPPITISFVEMSELNYEPGDVVPAHKHQIFEIRFMKSGKITSRLNKVTYNASKNLLFYIRPGDTHYQYTVEPTVMYHLGFVVTRHRSGGIFRNMQSPKMARGQIAKIRDVWSYPSTVFEAPEEITLSLERLFSDTDSKGRIDSNRLLEYIMHFMSALCGVLYKLNSKKSLLDINLGMLDSRTKSAVKASVSYIKENYAGRMDLNYLSRKINFSKRHLERLFREASGCTLNDYLMKVRTLKSYDLLKQPGYKVESAIKESGFNNSGRFYRCFKKYIGISPGKFKKYHSDIKTGKSQVTSLNSNKK